MSKYTILVAEIKPIKGVVTIADQKALGEIWPYPRAKAMYIWGPTKEEIMRKISVKLSKHYMVTIFTEAQFAKASYVEKCLMNVKFTKKQKEEAFII